MRYGALIPSEADKVIEFFTTEQPLAPGAYVHGLGRQEPNVFIAESVAALIMQVQPAIERSERKAQEALSSPGMGAEERDRMAENLTDSLIRRLSEDTSIWREEPEWLGAIRPAPGQS